MSREGITPFQPYTGAHAKKKGILGLVYPGSRVDRLGSMQSQ